MRFGIQRPSGESEVGQLDVARAVNQEILKRVSGALVVQKLLIYSPRA